MTITKQQRRAMARRYQSGRTTTVALAAEFHCSPSAVRYHLEAQGVPRNKPGTRFVVVANPRQLVDQYLTGATLTELARARGHSKDTVTRVLLENGVPIRPHADYFRLFSNAQEIRMGELYLTGATTTEIALEYQTDKSCVANVLERRGIPRRTTAESRHLRGTWRRQPGCRVEWP